MKRPITPEMRAFLTEPRFGVVGTTNPNGSPHLTAMWYLYEGDEVVFNTARGRLKDRNLQRDQRASFIVAEGYKFVRVDGRVTIVDEAAQGQADIRNMAIRYHGQERGEQMSRETFSKQERISYRMSAREVYAQGF
ncbi:MAG: PPOX class F420-dependent oxidoreductase [Chloroflexi bacterium]|nr:PPOX class F420-dependent oxidoreductase [Chloroflexota bacterium]MBI2982655.1 PPOX class F420-dependent oxidoreductase [Chloroflexota bacterium]